MRVEGKIVDVLEREIFSGSIDIEDGRIVNISRHATPAEEYIIPGFIDAHLHIESSLLTPENFGALVVKHGTIGVVADPHEIANVVGRAGVDFMIESSRRTPLRSHFMIPSSVPATPFDVTGGTLSAADVEQMASSGLFVGLAEVMNVQGVVMGDGELMQKIAAAKAQDLAIDGHAPMASGEALRAYAACGITTDHECTTLEEAEEKIALGMKILIREGSAVKNYAALSPLIASNPDMVMFCTDDSHPDDIISDGHIDKIVRRAVADGYDLFDTLKIASLNPINHYRLDCGGLEIGSRADFIVVEDLESFALKQSYIGGECVYGGVSSYCAGGDSLVAINNFNHEPITLQELSRAVSGEIPIIGLIPDEIVTKAESYIPSEPVENLESDVAADIAKLVYINRYKNTPPVVEYCRGFSLKRGAVASSISHDSHNIVAVGCSDQDLMLAINAIIESQGGLAVADRARVDLLPLPIAGIMSGEQGEVVAEKYGTLQRRVRELGSDLSSPFMTLSFLSLVVIPELKIGERGLFSLSKFDWI